jgi:hypothetical protein
VQRVTELSLLLFQRKEFTTPHFRNDRFLKALVLIY